MAPAITPDFSETVELNPGSYQARITDCQSKQTAKGATMLRWTLEVENNNEPKLNGRKVFHNTMISGAGAGMFKGLVRATLSPNYDGGPVDTDQILGKSVTIVVADGKDKEGNFTGFPEVKAIKRVS